MTYLAIVLLLLAVNAACYFFSDIKEGM